MTEQLSLFTGDWQDQVSRVLEELVNEYDLPEGSLYLSTNRGQTDTDKPVSYTVCIWEPDYPPVSHDSHSKNQIVTTISPSTVKSRPDDLDLRIREEQETKLHQYLPSDAVLLEQTKSDRENRQTRVRFNRNSKGLADYIRVNTEYCIKRYKSRSSSFACCSRYEECSDEKRCLHQNRLYSTACIYRQNLEQGKIFYGKNSILGKGTI